MTAAQGPDEELALGADVEQAGLEAEGDGQAAEDERRRLDERVDDGVRVAERAADERPVGATGAGPRSNVWPGTSSSETG